MTARTIHTEVCAAIRALLASVPPHRALISQQVDYQVRKAEVLDLIAVAEPAMTTTARDLAARARYEATQLANQY